MCRQASFGIEISSEFFFPRTRGIRMERIEGKRDIGRRQRWKRRNFDMKNPVRDFVFRGIDIATMAIVIDCDNDRYRCKRVRTCSLCNYMHGRTDTDVELSL